MPNLLKVILIVNLLRNSEKLAEVLGQAERAKFLTKLEGSSFPERLMNNYQKLKNAPMTYTGVPSTYRRRGVHWIEDGYLQYREEVDPLFLRFVDHDGRVYTTDSYDVAKLFTEGGGRDVTLNSAERYGPGEVFKVYDVGLNMAVAPEPPTMPRSDFEDFISEYAGELHSLSAPFPYYTYTTYGRKLLEPNPAYDIFRLPLKFDDNGKLVLQNELLLLPLNRHGLTLKDDLFHFIYTTPERGRSEYFLKEAADRYGYDGIVVPNVYDGGFLPQTERIYINSGNLVKAPEGEPILWTAINMENMSNPALAQLYYNLLGALPEELANSIRMIE